MHICYLQILCNSHLPFIGLNHKVEQELAWKVIPFAASGIVGGFDLYL